MLANKNVSTSELFDVLRRVDAQRRAEYFICVPVNPVDTGQAERTGPLFVLDATVIAAHERLDAILTAMRDIGLSAEGELGDYRPLRALDAAVRRFQPDQLVIAEARSAWLRLGMVDRVRAAYPIPVQHVVPGQSALELGLISSMGATPQLRQGLSQRQLTMIAIGGIIGAGFFVGSGVVIGKAGPAAFLTYALCGVLIILVMRMLGEMATANPSTGSFAEYAREALGGWAGFSVGWLYWYYWVIVVGFEAVAGAKVITYWFPAPLWLLSLGLMLLMTATNLFSVSSYGEFEFWFAGIKVAAIVLFLLLGSMYAFGLWPHRHADLSNLHAHGGFFPNGLSRRLRRHRRGDLLHGRRRGRDHRRRGDPRSGARHPAGDERGRGSYRDFLCRIGVSADGRHAVELRAVGFVAVRRGVEADGDSGCRPCDECGGAHRGAVVSELRALHRVSDAVRARRSTRSARPDAQSQPPRRALPCDRGLVGGGLPMRHHGRSRSEHGVPVSAQLVGRHRAARLLC